MLTAFSAALIIPFAVEGVRKKHFSNPKWVIMFHYSSMVRVSLMLFYSVGFISWIGPHAAFGGYNIYLHIVCPALLVFSFLWWNRVLITRSGCFAGHFNAGHRS